LFLKNNKWLDYLNKNVSIDLNQADLLQQRSKAIFLTIYQMFSNISFYSYPDEDFCYFKDFPHSRLILPKLKPNYKTSCSCTEIFLIQYSYKFSTYSDYYADTITTFYPNIQYYADEMFQNLFSSCINSSIGKVIKGKNKNPYYY